MGFHQPHSLERIVNSTSPFHCVYESIKINSNIIELKFAFVKKKRRNARSNRGLVIFLINFVDDDNT